MTIKKGDRLRYTGKYAHEQPEVFGEITPDFVPAYPPGTVVAFRDHKTKVTVLLDKVEGETDDLYADWPLTEVEKL